jgi:hypothetical protein
MPLIIPAASATADIGLSVAPFGAEARCRHDEPDAISSHECRHFRITEARGARGLRGHSA